MATEAAVAKRRAEAEGSIETSVSALAQKFGVEAAIAPVSGVRDLELRRVMQLETVAAVLTLIVETAASGESAGESAGDFPEGFPAQARSRLVKIGVSYAEVRQMNREGLIELDGIAGKTADEILEFFEKE